MWMGYPALTAERVGTITAPTLVISGDRDEAIPLAHTLDFYNWLPNSELAILPGLNHGTAISQPALFASTVADFVRRRGS